ncbi:phosphatidylglycerophosphatase A family protein [Ramlibacter tataouinensis]|uniref:Phosphatidylglycerophosphatase A n=1 Tax=Ramlibacter tataouinensis (strain ATCC BAA-407 / DSM 14655 / LMG 21543 / TTB310) TaxID=365046 RepID=F5Y1D1_RAMTT|nr:phosphatidylglycerophosphatase A [Ramlibacter tataouinensis]AEG94715.1 Candidate Phosphatidylglycerophosphatase [Ramlibacter tataouinensis TTB310]
MSVAAPSEAPAAKRPTVRFAFSHPAHAIALGFGIGLSPWAPGTAGTLWAWLSFAALQAWLPVAAIGWLLLASLVVGWWACSVTARHMNLADPGNIVWDEIVSFWLVLWLLMPAGLGTQVAAFVLFRFFDAAKPGPVGWADRLFHGHGWRGGLGVLLDDLVAALCTLLAIAAWRFAWRFI